MVVQEKKNWNDAEAHCVKIGGHLVSIDSREEQNFILRLFKESVGTKGWIGLNDRNQESLYEWTDGTTVEYEYWNSGQPDDAAAGQDCAALTKSNGRWYDENCVIQNSFVCEKFQGIGV